MQSFLSKLSCAVKPSIALGLMLVPAAELRAAGPFNVSTTADTHAVSPSSSPTDVNGAVSLRSAIEAANAQAGATTINVPAGTYSLTLGELDVSPSGGKTISIHGATAATTIVSQSDNVNRVFNIDPNSTGGSTATLSGLTIQGGTDKADNFGGAGILDGSLFATPMDVLNLQNCTIQHNHCQALNGSANPGGGVSMEGGNLTIAGCTFMDNSSGSSPGGAVFFFPQNVASTLSVSGSAFNQNSITDVTGAGVGGSAIFVGSTAASAAHSIIQSTFVNNSVAGTISGAHTYGAIQVQDSGTGNKLTLNACSFSGNSVTSVTHTTGWGGALAVNSGQVDVNFCRFFDNTADEGSAVFSSVVNAASINATDNWWGCDAGPGATGCNSITGDGAGGSFGSTVTFNPWLVLTFTPNPNPILVGGSTSLAASFLTDSSGQILGASSLFALVGLPITFNNPVLGSLSGAQTAIQANGTATVGFTAGGTAGTGHASAILDNATVTADITINATSFVVTLNPSDTTVCDGSTATFTAAAAGTPAPTIQWQVSAGGGPFADITGATSSTLSFTATTAENGNQYRAVFSNGSILDSSAATLSVNTPPIAGVDALGTIEGVAVNAPVLKLLANDSSPIGGTLSLVAVTTPSTAGATVALNGQFITYTPPAGFFGSDSFTILSATRVAPPRAW